MSEIPTWWLAVSAVFFVVNVVMMIAIVYLAVHLVKILQGLQPKIETISTRVDAIGQRVEEVATSTQATLASLGGRAQSVATSVDTIAHVASRQFERFSPYLVGALTAIRLVKALAEVKQGRSLAKATTQANLDEDRKEEALEKAAKVDKGRRKRA